MIARSLRFLMAGVILTLATGTQAQENVPNPWYVAFGAGASWYNSPTITGAGSVNVKNPGYLLTGAFGRYIDDIRVIRLEGEVLFESVNVSNIGGTSASGSQDNLGLMFNAYYDFRTGTEWTPYLGGGLGYGRVYLNNVSFGATTIDDSTDAFSWQFKAGVSYQVSPTWTVNLGYRLFGTDNLTFSDSTGTEVDMGGTLTQSAELGFRFHF